MWTLLLKYIVMMQAGPEKAIQPSIQQGVVRFRVNKCNLKKAESQNGKKRKKKKKKKKVRRGEATSRLWNCTGQKNVWLLRHDVQHDML